MSTHEGEEHEPTLTWEPCGICWGQRRLYHEIDGRLHAETCQSCLGIGEHMRVTRSARSGGPGARVTPMDPRRA